LPELPMFPVLPVFPASGTAPELPVFPELPELPELPVLPELVELPELLWLTQAFVAVRMARCKPPRVKARASIRFSRYGTAHAHTAPLPPPCRQTFSAMVTVDAGHCITAGTSALGPEHAEHNAARSRPPAAIRARIRVVSTSGRPDRPSSRNASATGNPTQGHTRWESEEKAHPRTAGPAIDAPATGPPAHAR